MVSYKTLMKLKKNAYLGSKRRVVWALFCRCCPHPLVFVLLVQIPSSSLMLSSGCVTVIRCRDVAVVVVVV